MADQLPPNDNPEYQNFVVGLRGFSYVGKRLEPYIREGISRLHAKIINHLGGHPVNCCRTRCSDRFVDTKR